MTKQNEQRKSVRRQGNRREKYAEIPDIKEKKEQTILILHGPAPEKKASSVWSWHEEFLVEWSETFITKKRK